jgi:hypothetical protein
MTEQETSDKLAIIPEESAIFQSIRTSSALTQADVAFQVENFTDLELTSYLRECHKLHRVMTTPAAASLIARFKAARKRKELYCGFSDFDKMCPALTGFSSRQIRNYADGYATPPKAAAKVLTPKTAQEMQDEKDADALQARTQATIDEARRQSQLREEARIAAKGGAEKVQQDAAELVQPVPVTSVPVNLVAAKTQRELETAIEIIHALVYALPAGNRTKDQIAARKLAVNFLNNSHGGLKEQGTSAQKAAA